jgi:hypothetical protein
VVSPIADPRFLVIGDVALLLHDFVLEQIARLSPIEVSPQGFGRGGPEVNHPFLSLCADTAFARIEINILDAQHSNLANSTSRRVQEFHQGTIPWMRRRADQFLNLRLGKRTGQRFRSGTSLEESGSYTVHHAPEVEEVEKAPERSQPI